MVNVVGGDQASGRFHRLVHRTGVPSGLASQVNLTGQARTHNLTGQARTHENTKAVPRNRCASYYAACKSAFLGPSRNTYGRPSWSQDCPPPPLHSLTNLSMPDSRLRPRIVSKIFFCKPVTFSVPARFVFGFLPAFGRIPSSPNHTPKKRGRDYTPGTEAREEAGVWRVCAQRRQGEPTGGRGV